MQPSRYGRLSVHVTETTFFAVKDLCRRLGRSDFGPPRAQVMRELVKRGLPHLNLKKIDFQAQLAHGTKFRRMTLVLPNKYIEKIRDQMELGYSVNWTVERVLRLGLSEFDRKQVEMVAP